MLPVYGLVLVTLIGCAGLQYEENPTGLTVIGWEGDPMPESLVIPASVNGTPVTEIKDWAFEWDDGVKSVTIPGGLTKIGMQTFRSCWDLTSVTFLDGATTVGYSMFENCRNLSSVTIPNSVTTIGNHAFAECKSLTSIKIPDGVEKIGDGAFAKCTGLTSIVLPKGLKEWDDWVFSGCTSLSSVTIPDGISMIGDSAFSDCVALTSVTIPNSVRWIGSSAFRNCIGLTSVTIPDGMRWIGYGAFAGCSGLTSMTIPGSVKEIKNGAFRNCTGLNSVTILDGVTKIEDTTFSGCSGLTSVTIPSSVTEIGRRTFAGCSKLSSIGIEVCNIQNAKNVLRVLESTSYPTYTIQLVLLDGLKSIENFAFMGCPSVTSVTIPDGVTEVGESAFVGCTGLTSITLPKSVTKIGPSAFAECSGLTSIVIPDSVTEIGESAFAGCTGLTSITLPKHVTKINPLAFAGCSGLTSIVIPDSVTEIGESAFTGCARLTSVTLTDDVTTIGKQVFSGEQRVTINLKSQDSRKTQTLVNALSEQEVGAIHVFLADGGVERIDDAAFANQKRIVSVELSESVKHLGKNAFVGCTDLQTITLRFSGKPPVGAFPYFWKFCKWEVPSEHQAAWETAIAQGRFNGVEIAAVDPSGTESMLSVAKAPEKGRMALITGTPEANLRFAVAMGDVEESKRFAEEVTELDATEPQEGKMQQLTLLEECLATGQTEIAEILYKRGAAGVDIAKAEFWKSIPSESVLLDVVKWLGVEDREVLRNGKKAQFSPNLAFVTFLRLNKLLFAEAVRSYYGLSCQSLRIEDFDFEDFDFSSTWFSTQQMVALVDYLVKHGTPLDDPTEDYSVLVALLKDQEKEISETKRAVLLYLIEQGADVNASIKTRLISKQEELRIEDLARDITQSSFLFDDLLERAGATEEALREAERAFEELQQKLENLPWAMAMFFGDSIYTNPILANVTDTAFDEIATKETQEIVLKALEKSGCLDYDTVETPVLFFAITRGESALANAMLEHGATLPCIKRDPKNGDVNAIDEALRVGNRELAQRLRQLERQRARNR